jgi:MFS superfamily sulfate permease-like transporter
MLKWIIEKWDMAKCSALSWKLTVAGIMVILALTLLTPYFYFIPKATLSSVIICAVLFMVEVGLVKPMWKSNSEYHFTTPSRVCCMPQCW